MVSAALESLFLEYVLALDIVLDYTWKLRYIGSIKCKAQNKV